MHRQTTEVANVLHCHVMDQIKLLYYSQSVHNNSQNKQPVIVTDMK